MSLDVAGTYKATDPVLVDGKKASLKLDVSGNLAVTASGGATATNQTTLNTEIGIVTEAAPATDTASSGLNGRLQRIAQRLTSLIAQIPAALGRTTASGSLSVTLASDNGPNSTSRLLSSAGTTNATSVKGSAGSLYKIVGNNTVAAKKYLKFYNKATAPTVGSDTPVLTIVLLASAAFDFDIPAEYFSTGIGYAITGAAADADTTAIGAGDIECLNLVYA